MIFIKDFLANEVIDFDCPKCNHTIKIKLKQIGSTVKCPNCNVDIFIEDGNPDALNDIDNAFNDLEKELQKIDKSFKF